MSTHPEPVHEALSAHGLTKVYGGVTVLDKVDLIVRPRAIQGIVGHNGAGKSTLFKILVGAVEPTAGTIGIGDATFSSLSPRQSFHLGVELIPQEPNLVPSFSARENIVVGHYPASRPGRVRWRQVAEEARTAAERVGLRGSLDIAAAELAPVDQRLVMLARAVFHARRYLILDEPTAPLTDREVTRLLDVMRELRGAGMGLIFCSHRLDEVLAVCDDVMVLQNGRTIAEKAASEFTHDELVSAIGGDLVSRGNRPAGADSTMARGDDPLLAVRNLSGRRVNNVSFEVHAGEILGIAGLAGSGRSEVARILAGVQPAVAGEIVIDGFVASLSSPRDATRHKIALVPENRHRDGCVLDMSLGANLGLPTIARRSKFGLIRRGVERAATSRMIEELRIQPPNIDAPLRSFSGGNQQKAVVGKWLLTDSRIFIFDEPTAGVDVGAAAEIHRLIRDLASQGRAIILICSEFEELEGLAQRAIVLREGEIICEVAGAEIKKERMLSEIYGARPAEVIS